MDDSSVPQTAVPGLGASDAKQSDTYIDFLSKAIKDFEDREHVRSAQEYKLQLAKEFIQREQWDNTLRILRPLWQSMTFRKEGFWDITEEIGWTLRDVAAKAGDGGTIVAVDWELLNRTFTQKADWRYDIGKSLNDVKAVSFKPTVVVRDEDVHSFLSATFAFDQAEAKVGELCASQLTVTSHAMPNSPPVSLNVVRISFQGSLKPVILHHRSASSDGRMQTSGLLFSKVVLREEPDDQAPPGTGRNGKRTVLAGEADLTFPPGKSHVFEFICPLREPGEARAISATFSMTAELFDLDYVVNFNRTVASDVWWSQKLARRRLVRADPHALIILPKPPKMELRFNALKEQYYTNETIRLELEIINGEEEESISHLSIHIAGDQVPGFDLKLENPLPDNTDDTVVEPSTISLGPISSADSKVAFVDIAPAVLSDVYDLTVDLSYNLVSDLATPISRRTVIRIVVVSPFEANYDFSPRLDLRPWPTFFDHTEGNEKDQSLDEATFESATHGLAQKWCLTARYASFAHDTLAIEDVDLELQSSNGGITCTASQEATNSDSAVLIEPKSIEECHFSVVTQKLSLDDRRAASLDLLLVMKWRRTVPGATLNTTKLPVPRLLVASSEPRVLASVSYSTAIPSLIHLQYTIENPSMHFLTFGVVMNPSESFAFSGVKSSTIQLVPLSRRSIQLQILPLVRGEWIRPQFVIKDRYFQKILKVAPTDGMKVDKDGILVWVPPEED